MSTGTKSEALTANSQSLCLRGTLGTERSPRLPGPGRVITGSSSGSSPDTRYPVEGTPEPRAPRDILPVATPIRRRGKSMSRRVGQNGNVFVKPNAKTGGVITRKVCVRSMAVIGWTSLASMNVFVK